MCFASKCSSLDKYFRFYLYFVLPNMLLQLTFIHFFHSGWINYFWYRHQCPLTRRGSHPLDMLHAQVRVCLPGQTQSWGQFGHHSYHSCLAKQHSVACTCPTTGCQRLMLSKVYWIEFSLYPWILLSEETVFSNVDIDKFKFAYWTKHRQGFHRFLPNCRTDTLKWLCFGSVLVLCAGWKFWKQS